MREEPQRRGDVQRAAGAAVGVGRGDPEHHDEHRGPAEPEARRDHPAQDTGGQSGRSVTAALAAGARKRRAAGGRLRHERHAPNGTLFSVATGEPSQCRPKYAYVLFPVEGCPVTQGQHTPDLTPAQAFDALYAFCAPALVRQSYLLTGRRDLARESVERAFQLAWERWPEVARDRDPAGWVRAAAHDYALSPWHRMRRRHRLPEPPLPPGTPAAPAPSPADRALMAVLLELPPRHRRTLLLYDGVGLDLPETAAETEASTPATAHRLMLARETVAARLPELSDPAELPHRLARLASSERLDPGRPPHVRTDGEQRVRVRTRAAFALTVVIAGATALTLHIAPTRYEPPVPAGTAVRGVPPRVVLGPLSGAEQKLRAKLRKETSHGPERLVPETR
ncbi:RNA polymerase sigma factor [Streptomyces sp. YIM S03343]